MFSSITFSLFWVIFHYNLLYVTVFWSNTRGLLYLTALNQLFTDVYVMKLCMINLFFLICDNHNRAICVSQTMIMIIATAMTLDFQFLLNDAVALLLQFMSLIKIREEKELKYNRTEASNHLQILIHKCAEQLFLTRNLISVNAIFSNMNHKIEDFTANKHNSLILLVFQHESLHIQRSVIWIPDNCLRISDDEISCVK